MRTFAQEQNQSQKQVSLSLARSNTPAPERGHRANLVLQSQRISGNQAVQRMLQTNAEEFKAGLTGTASPRFGYDFSHIPIYSPTVGAMQTKLSISKPGDIYEHEADRVAEQVMRTPEPRLQRACSCAGSCCDDKKKKLQMKSASANGFGHHTAPPIVHDVLCTPGHSLDTETRTFMERRFGHDFSGVRVHADSQAEQSAKAVHARAYTVGGHIVFGAGQYAAHSHAGRSLLAHELAHTIQQGAADSQMLQRDPQPGADDLPCTLGEMRLAKGYPCVPYTLPGRDCPIGQVKFAGQCVPFRQRPGLLKEKLHLDPMLQPPNVTAPGTSTTGTTGTGTPATGATPAGKGGPPKKPCTYTVNYAKPVEVDCQTVWKAEKKGPPPKDLCGKRAIFEITSVSASDPSCPLVGLEVSEKVATIWDGHSCSQPGFTWPPPTPCKIGAGGKLTGCTDTLTMCGPASDLKFGGCEENVKQEILVDGKTVETHTITFELDVSDSRCISSKVTRK